MAARCNTSGSAAACYNRSGTIAASPMRHVTVAVRHNSRGTIDVSSGKVSLALTLTRTLTAMLTLSLKHTFGMA